ncbi:MAG TPA: GAF and ANTAR domain-containing protein [Acidimicrobiales bacterium]|nr:GAF and ANTAR domain-containing protein [Acidimicrobiales bacterium]
MDGREEWLARTFVELADTLVADYDIVDFLSTLAERCVELLDTVEVGLVLLDRQGALQVMASSTERMRVAELFEVQNEEGPCFDCQRAGEQIINEPLDTADDRWPRFGPMARDAGFRMAHALPLRLRQDVIGAMNIFDTELREMTSRQVNLSQALADAATIGILQERSVRQQTDIAGHLQGALNSRIVIEQAKGVVAEQQKVSMEEAFAMLRGYARNSRVPLSELAHTIVDRSLSSAVLRSVPPLGRDSAGFRHTP